MVTRGNGRTASQSTAMRPPLFIPFKRSPVSPFAPFSFLAALSLLLSFTALPLDAYAQRRRTTTPATRARTDAPQPQPATARALTVRTEPRAAVWIDGLRWGTTNASGELVLKNVPAGRRVLRVRATGFRERTIPLAPAQRGTLEVALTRIADEAEILFQQAEDAREGNLAPDAPRPDAAALYQGALRLRPRFPAAHVGLARVFLSRDMYDEALEQIAEARRDRPAYPEASAVEGRIMRATANNDAAITSYRRAIREGRGVQPEAYAGLGIVYEERGEYDEAVTAFRKAISQLYDTEPALYQLLGAAYEKLENWREAVVAYEKYLALAPEGRLAPAIQSIIDQLRVQAAEQEQP